MKHLFSTRTWMRIAVVTIGVSAILAVSISHHAQSQGARTETSMRYDKDGSLVKTETDYDAQNRVVETRELKGGKLRKRTHFSYPNGFKKPNTSTTEYGPDGTTPQSTTNSDVDKDGNPTSTVTTIYDGKGNEIGGSKRERDPKTGKDRCYRWNAGKQVYEEERCPETLTDEELMEWKYGFHPPQVKPSDNAKVETRDGLQRVSFSLPQGRISIVLPDDMMAGDTISGTVIAEPQGQSETERTKNMAELSGLAIEITPPKNPDGTRDTKIKATVSAVNVPIKINLPPAPPLTGVSSSGSGGLGITLTNTTGSFTVGSAATIPIELVHLSLQSVAPIQVPTIGQQGRPIEIIGPFDGNASNTRLMYGPARSSVQDFENNTENVTGGFGLLQPLAESPRKIVFRAPGNVTGPIELYLQEGNKQTTGTFRNIGVNLTAPKTNLLKGEHTELHVEVNGLQGIKEPVPLTLQSNGVITMEGGMYQPLMIQPSQVGADGRYTTTRGITGVQAGGWNATATVVTQPFNIVLRDPDPPQTVLVNSFTGDYVFCGSGPKLTGTGQVKRQGCVFTLTDDRIDRRVNGTFDGCAPVDNGRFWILYSAGASTDIRVTVTKQPKQTRVYFNPLGRPAPPLQDVSAFATCP